ncbi:hypothetical protein MauCBS54593_006637 [Microsporum audouinii]
MFVKIKSLFYYFPYSQKPIPKRKINQVAAPTQPPLSVTLQDGTHVLYLYAAPLDEDVLKAELKVVRDFVTQWNANTADVYSVKPDTVYATPPTLAILVTPGESKHITALVCSATGWNSNPKEGGATVHIYSHGDNPANGYRSYYIQTKNRNQLKSPAMVTRITDSLANSRGTFTC